MTPKPRARLALLVLGVLGGAVVAFGPGCSLDWNERAEPSESGPSETNAPDVMVADTGTDVTVDDAPADSGADCATLKATVDATKYKAQKCGFVAGQCKTTVKDECKCDVIVKTADSPEDNASRAPSERTSRHAHRTAPRAARHSVRRRVGRAFSPARRTRSARTEPASPGNGERAADVTPRTA